MQTSPVTGVRAPAPSHAICKAPYFYTDLEKLKELQHSSRSHSPLPHQPQPRTLPTRAKTKKKDVYDIVAQSTAPRLQRIAIERRIVALLALRMLLLLRVVLGPQPLRQRQPVAARVLAAQVHVHEGREAEGHQHHRHEGCVAGDVAARGGSACLPAVSRGVGREGEGGGGATYRGAYLLMYMKPEMQPPRLPKPTCMAMPTPRLSEPPMLLLFQATPSGTRGKMPVPSLAARSSDARPGGLTASGEEGADVLHNRVAGRQQHGEADNRDGLEAQHEEATLPHLVGDVAGDDGEDAGHDVRRHAHQLRLVAAVAHALDDGGQEQRDRVERRVDADRDHHVDVDLPVAQSRPHVLDVKVVGERVAVVLEATLDLGALGLGEEFGTRNVSQARLFFLEGRGGRTCVDSR